MVSSFSQQAVESDPEGALAWASTVGDNEQRARLVGNLTHTWLRNDPTAARKWIAASTQLTPERKAQLLQNQRDD